MVEVVVDIRRPAAGAGQGWLNERCDFGCKAVSSNQAFVRDWSFGKALEATVESAPVPPAHLENTSLPYVLMHQASGMRCLRNSSYERGVFVHRLCPIGRRGRIPLGFTQVATFLGPLLSDSEHESNGGNICSGFTCSDRP